MRFHSHHITSTAQCSLNTNTIAVTSSSSPAVPQGLTHAGSLKCVTIGGVVNRQPSGCIPDWYGDRTSFMGGGPDLQLPNAIKFKVCLIRPKKLLNDP